MDAIATVTFDLSAAAPLAGSGPAAAAPSVFDIAHFNAALDSGSAAASTAAPAVSSVSSADSFRTVAVMLQGLDGGAQNIGAAAAELQGEGSQLEPAQVLKMTLVAHQFLFNCELTSNVANRTSDGVQQLFREQS